MGYIIPQTIIPICGHEVRPITRGSKCMEGKRSSTTGFQFEFCMAD